MAGLEIDFKLETTKDKTSVIPKDAEVWMYASLMSNAAGATDSFETVACQVKYNQKAQLEELTVDQIKKAGKPSSFIGKKNFVESKNGDAVCTKLAQLNPNDNMKNQSPSQDPWKLDLMEPFGFIQDHKTSPEFSLVSCSVMSSRTDTPAGHDYKIGQTIKIKQGYKIRANADSLSSLFASDSSIEEYQIQEKAGAMQLGALLGAAATFAAMIAF